MTTYEDPIHASPPLYSGKKMSQIERQQDNGPKGMQFDSSGDQYLLKREIQIETKSKKGSLVNIDMNQFEQRKMSQKSKYSKELLVDEHSYNQYVNKMS